MTNHALISACGLAACLTFLAGCHSDGLYSECPLSNSIIEACSQLPGEGVVCGTDADCLTGLTCVDGACADSTMMTCVVEEHPFCLEQICASWQGAPSVCTRACEIDDDCPGTGRCMAHTDIMFCVEPEYLADWSPFEQSTPTKEGTACGDGLACAAESECCPEGSALAATCAPEGTCDTASVPD